MFVESARVLCGSACASPSQQRPTQQVIEASISKSRVRTAQMGLQQWQEKCRHIAETSRLKDPDSTLLSDRHFQRTERARAEDSTIPFLSPQSQRGPKHSLL
jgi:hypothetical protein